MGALDLEVCRRLGLRRHFGNGGHLDWNGRTVVVPDSRMDRAAILADGHQRHVQRCAHQNGFIVHANLLGTRAKRVLQGPRNGDGSGATGHP
ncbi:MAG: hypothetical protein EB058_14945, partial [Proteobacteria bacterium]|nr:hypothetical protein [Pseudomonadota bacterium]